MLYSIDWANKLENIAVYDGIKITSKMPKPKAGMLIVTENIPLKYAKPYLDEGVAIYRCNTDLVARRRELDGLEKSHDNDAIALYQLYNESPEKFRQLKYDPIFSRFNSLYSVFKEVQHLRVATSNRVYANNDPQVQAILDGLERQEKEILKIINSSLKTMPVYVEFLSQIKGIGPAISAGLLSYVGEFERFPTVSHMMAYFGLDVRDGKSPRKQKGQQANWHQKGRALLLGVIADSFVKQRTPLYREIYDAVKANELLRCEKRHIADKRARRRAVKEFVKDFYKAYKRWGRVSEDNDNLNSFDRPRRKKKMLVAT